jgi:hypothetical protein
MKRRKRGQRRRNYKAEYRRRIKRGLVHGLSRSQARGHPKAKEFHLVANHAKALADHQFQIALRKLRDGKSAAATARSLGLSPERFRRQLAVSGIAVKHGRKWQVSEDAPREMLLFSNGQKIKITVPDFATAGTVGRYLNAVWQLLWNNEPNYLEPFVGEAVTDSAGQVHPFETDPNTIYELSHTGAETFEQVYRIVVT